jgi:hypothetical protein
VFVPAANGDPAIGVNPPASMSILNADTERVSRFATYRNRPVGSTARAYTDDDAPVLKSPIAVNAPVVAFTRHTRTLVDRPVKSRLPFGCVATARAVKLDVNGEPGPCASAPFVRSIVYSEMVPALSFATYRNRGCPAAAAATVSVAGPLIDPEVAVMVVLPAATLVASPALLIVATPGVAALHVTLVVIFAVLPSS